MNVLRIAQEKVDFLPVARVTDDTSILTLKNLVFEPLCRWADGSVHPGLFARWECADDGRSWHFFIRDDAVFHDGKPCDAEDVIAYIKGVLRSVDTFGMKWSYARYFADTVFSAQEKGCVRVVTAEPFADIPEIFSEFYVCRENASGAPVLGTGRYRVSDYQPGTHVDLERISGSSTPPRITVTAFAEAEARYRALTGNDVDVAVKLEHMEQTVDFDPAYRWSRTLNTLSVMYYLNCASGPFVAPQARLAINYAVDAQFIIDELFQGLGVPSSTVVSPYHMGHGSAAAAPIPYDKDKAKALFDQAGITDEVVIRTPTSMPEKSDRISKMIRASLADVGVKARLDVQEDRPEYAREVGRKEMGDMAIFDSSPHSTFRVLNDKISSSVKAVWWQGYHDTAVEEMIRLANRTISNTDRARAYRSCLARLNANPPWLYLFHPIEVMACKKDLGNISLDHKGIVVVR
ncbi:MAG: hypothetical protein HN403_05955 [Rhodospirillales bacterium]|jgi:peptide/nickel transport system substrate-binding protein|nr:hypothetical protein [Rhodospirillales bacterium]